jgi:hypothetical protein
VAERCHKYQFESNTIITDSIKFCSKFFFELPHLVRFSTTRTYFLIDYQYVDQEYAGPCKKKNDTSRVWRALSMIRFEKNKAASCAAFC